MEFSIDFVRIFATGVILISPLLLILLFCIVLLGFLAARRESWKFSDAIYWTCITALTVGYGDMSPKKRMSRIASVLIGWLGILFTGLLVALAVQAASRSFEKHIIVESAQYSVIEP